MTFFHNISYEGGYAVFFVWILANRAGIPLPATPALLGAGVLAGAGELHFPLVVLLATSATLASDSVWFALGRRFGHRMLHLVCRLAPDPLACARHAEHFLHRHGVRSLLFTKFLPGMNRTILPLTGTARTRFTRFLMYDAVGAVLWAGVYAGLGFIFSDEIQYAADRLIRIGGYAVLGFLVLAIIGYVVLRMLQRRKGLRLAAVQRISPSDLYGRISRGEDVRVFDLRDDEEFAPDPRVIPGARRVDPLNGQQYWSELSPDTPVVLYCCCPGEATSLELTNELRKAGFRNVHPLAGGFNGWRDAGLPLVEAPQTQAAD